MILRIPMPVSANARLTRSYRGRGMVETSKYRSWKEQAIWLIKPQIDKPFSPEAKIHVDVTLHFPDKRKRDVDNPMKGFLDACSIAGVWNDDSQVDVLNIRRGEIHPHNGELIATITEIL